MRKKGQGLSLNTIIVAAIVLIVLVVLWAIFTGRMGDFTKNLQKQEAKTDAKAQEFEKLAGGDSCAGRTCSATTSKGDLCEFPAASGKCGECSADGAAATCGAIT